MNPDSIIENKRYWEDTKVYFDGYVEHLAKQKVDLPHPNLVKLEDINDEKLTKCLIYDTSVILLSENLLDCLSNCKLKGYNPALVINTTMYLLADASNGSTSESSELFIRSNAHTVIKDEADEMLSLNDAYHLSDVVALRDSSFRWCEPYLFNSFLYVQKHTEVMVKGSKREFETSEAYDDALMKVRRIFINAVLEGYDALILDSFRNPHRDYPVDSYIQIINDCIEQYGAFFKLIVIKPFKIAKTKFEKLIKTKAGHKNIVLETPTIDESGIDESTIEDIIINSDAEEDDIRIEIESDVEEDELDIPQISDDDEIDDFDKLVDE